MPDGPLLLGLDIGSSRTKAVLVDGQGREVQLVTTPTPFVTDGDRVEMPAEGLRRCVGELVAGLDDARQRVAAVGLAGMAESGAPLDGSRRALAPIIAWHDGRGEEAVALLERNFGQGLAVRIGQPVRTVLTAAKLGWLVDHGLGGMERWLGVPELILHALTGAEVTEFSLAARTGCYDVGAREWMPEVPHALGFSIDVFPPVRPAGTVMGRISAEGAGWSGLVEGVPITIAGHDHLAGMAGAGVGPDWLGNSVGTAETIVARSSTLPDVARALDLRVAVTVYPGGEQWAALVSAARAGKVLEAAAAALGRTLEDLDELADGASPADVGDAVEALARGGHASLPDRSPGEVWAGLLEALTARTVDGYDRLTQLVGPADGLVVFGGGGVSNPWLRAKEAGIAVPVRRSTVGAAVARGAAVHAGIALGWWPSADDAPNPEPAPGGPLSSGDVAEE